MESARPKTPIMTKFPTKSVTWNLVKKLPTLGTHYKAIHDPEPTLPYPRAYYPTYPTLPEELTHHYTCGYYCKFSDLLHLCVILWYWRGNLNDKLQQIYQFLIDQLLLYTKTA